MAAGRAPGTPSWLRARNERTGLELLLDQGPLTRNQISALSGLSRPTTTLIVSHLEDAGLVEVVGEISGGRGPNATSYAVRAGSVLGVAIDVDPFHVRSTVVDAMGAEHPIVQGDVRRGTDPDSAARDLSDAIERASLAAGLDAAAVRYVVVGIQGAVDVGTDEIKYVNDLESWPSTGVRASLEAALGRQVTIENDVNLAAVAERADGAGADQESFALLWLSDGLGLALDLNGAVYRGAAGGAGEIGLLPTPWSVQADAKNLEELFGSGALERIAADAGIDARGDDLAPALAGHPARDAVLAAFARRVAAGVEPILAIIDPAVLVLGGPIGTLGGEELADLVSAELRERTQWRQPVRTSGISHDPVLRGAQRVLVEQVRQHLLDQVGAE